MESDMFNLRLVSSALVHLWVKIMKKKKKEGLQRIEELRKFKTVGASAVAHLVHPLPAAPASCMGARF